MSLRKETWDLIKIQLMHNFIKIRETIWNKTIYRGTVIYRYADKPQYRKTENKSALGASFLTWLSQA